MVGDDWAAYTRTVYMPGEAGAVSVEEAEPVDALAENGTLGVGANSVLPPVLGQLISVRLDPPPVKETFTTNEVPGATVFELVSVLMRRFPAR
jgi:hypothetical protein